LVFVFAVNGSLAANSGCAASFVNVAAASSVLAPRGKEGRLAPAGLEHADAEWRRCSNIFKEAFRQQSGPIRPVWMIGPPDRLLESKRQKVAEAMMATAQIR
jgi:hypothetical protein